MQPDYLVSVEKFADGLKSLLSVMRGRFGKLLGTVKNLAPTAIIHTEKEGDPPEMITNPAKLAKIFN